MTKVSVSRAAFSDASNPTNLWRQFDDRGRSQGTVSKGGSNRIANRPLTLNKFIQRNRFRWVVDAILPFTLIIIAAIAVHLPVSLPDPARPAVFAFLLAVILWSTTTITADYVALLTVMTLILLGGSSQEKLFDALASDVVWLMIGAFILGSAVQKAGLAVRLTQLVMSRVQTVRGMLWLLTLILIPLSFLVPSTSGRAAVMIPVFRSITGTTRDRRIVRAIALLIPTIIFTSTIVAMVGAGSHLIANDLLYQITHQRISFAQWAIYGLPFGIISSLASCWVIMRLFLDEKRLQTKLQFPHVTPQPLSRTEWFTLVVVGVMMALWFTENWHGLKIATVTMVGALFLTLPGQGVLKWKEGVKAVSWNLVIFVGAAFVLGQSLIDSGAAQWAIDQLFAVSGLASTESQPVILISIGAIALTSHLYMTSHTARAAALVPAILYLANSLQLNPVAVLFLSTVGMDYCLTFPVSSKALLMFQGIDGGAYKPTDLLRLSAVLMPVHLGLIVLFYYSYWHWVGLTL